MSTGYECDRCGRFVGDPGGWNEDVYHLDDCSVWISVSKKGSRASIGDLCPPCWKNTLKALIAHLQAEQS